MSLQSSLLRVAKAQLEELRAIRRWLALIASKLGPVVPPARTPTSSTLVIESETNES